MTTTLILIFMDAYLLMLPKEMVKRRNWYKVLLTLNFITLITYGLPTDYGTPIQKILKWIVLALYVILLYKNWTDDDDGSGGLRVRKLIFSPQTN